MSEMNSGQRHMAAMGRSQKSVAERAAPAGYRAATKDHRISKYNLELLAGGRG